MTKRVPTISHDRFFKQIISKPQVAHEFFLSHIPEKVLSLVDLDTTHVEKTSFIDSTIGRKEADMLFSVDLKDGEKGYFYILIEHQRKDDHLMAFRMLKYMLCICDHHIKTTGDKKLPLIYPMIYYTGMKAPQMITDIWELFHNKELAKELFINPYQLINVRNFNDEDIHTRMWSGLLEYMMKHVDAEDIAPFITKAKSVLQIIGKKDYDYFLEVLWYSNTKGESKNTKEVLNIFYETAPEERRDEIMTILQSIKEDAKNEGKLEVAKNLLQSGIAIETIAKATGLSKDQISALIH